MANSIKILSIDDSKAVHAFLDRTLTGTNHVLVHAMCGKDGLSKLAEVNSGIQIVLLDWEMPDLTGPEVLAEIRKSGNQVPVIMMTSKNDPEDIMKMIQAGASEYIMKPFTPDVVLEKIESVLAGH